jgi:hypothetical protein
VRPPDNLHQRLAVLTAHPPPRHGFALGGGNALIAHGVIERPTEDIDLFSNDEHGVAAAAGAVQAALTAAGFTAERQDKTDGLSDIFYGMGKGLAEWIISAPGGRQMALQMAYFDRAQEPVVMEFGPVLDLSRTWPVARSAPWPAALMSATSQTQPPCWSGTPQRS